LRLGQIGEPEAKCGAIGWIIQPTGSTRKQEKKNVHRDESLTPSLIMQVQDALLHNAWLLYDSNVVRAIHTGTCTGCRNQCQTVR